MRSVFFIKRQFYVDNGIGCESKVGDAIGTLRTIIELLGKFNISVHKINSHSSRVKEEFTKREPSSNSELAFENTDIHNTLDVS